jgi:hypothetical protein
MYSDLLLKVALTVIKLGFPPSLSETSSKPGEFNSTTVYTPGITSENSNTPFESVEVLATTVPLVKRYSTTTLVVGT